MKASTIAVVDAASAVAGAYVENNIFSLQKTVNIPYADVALGALIALAGWYTKYDGVSDAVEAFGIGYALGAIL